MAGMLLTRIENWFATHQWSVSVSPVAQALRTFDVIFCTGNCQT